MRIECKYDEMLKLDDVEKRWHPDNENHHPEEQIRALAKVIGKIGVRHAIHISKSSGKICGGHGRYLAFRMLGYDEVPVIWENFEDEIEEINYRASDNIGQYAEFNNHEFALNMEKVGIDLKEVDFEEFGLINFDFEVLENTEIDTDKDITPKAPYFPTTRKGDVWIMGEHRIMCGDSTSIDDVDKLMNKKKADMVFTDPPYGVSYQSSQRTKSEKFEVLNNDDDFLDFLPCLEAHTKDNTPWIIWTSHHVYPKWREMYDHYYKSTIVWYKRGGGMGDLEGDYATDYELGLYCTKGRPKFIGKRPPAVWDIGKDAASKYVHPTQKPAELSMNAMDHFLSNGSIVMDLFLGSGSTLIGCESTSRKCYGMELSDKFCDVIIKRWQNLTGKQAHLESTGEPFVELDQNQTE